MSKTDDGKDLLERFKALKGPATTLTPVSPSEQKPDDLAARFLRFSAKEENTPLEAENTDTHLLGEDDKTLEELLADLGPQDQWLVGSDESEEVLNLMIEARVSLLSGSGAKHADSTDGDEVNSINGASRAAAELSADAQDEVKESLHNANKLQQDAVDDSDQPQETTSHTEDEEAASALQRILDELSLEKSLSNQDLLSEGQVSTTETKDVSQNAEEVSLEPILDLPSTPDSKPLPRKTTNSLESADLDLPSAPINEPSKKKPKTTLPTFTNEEIESWCIICNDDATVRCNGCDGDLYCAKCWREGHTGPDAGYEEKQHRWAKYAKPR